MKYKWSVYSPSKKAEILEAERASDEIRDIMSRMIGAEIRYVRMGYWVRRAPYGYATEKIETKNGKRTILKPSETEGEYAQKMFELRARGTMSDQEIVDKINQLGYVSRVNVARDKNDRTKILKTRGGQKLSLKTFWRIIENPVYAGVNSEAWMQGKPMKCQFDGLVSIDTWNKANKGKNFISEQDGEITIGKRPPAPHLVNKGAKDAEFPFKKQVLCPHCEKPLYGSASRGKLGKYYNAYHCNRGHYYRVSEKEFNNTIEEFVRSIQISPEYLEALNKLVVTEWQRREAEKHQEAGQLQERVSQLKTQARAMVDKFKILTSETAIKYVEEELLKTEEEIKELTELIDKPVVDDNEPNVHTVMQYVTYFCQNLEQLVLGQNNLVAQAGYFGVLFDKAPTYAEINLGTPKLAAAIQLNNLFQLKNRGDTTTSETVTTDTSNILDEILHTAEAAAKINFRTPKTAISTDVKRPLEENNSNIGLMAGDEGFEPPMPGPEPGALPLGQSPLDCLGCIASAHVWFIMLIQEVIILKNINYG